MSCQLEHLYFETFDHENQLLVYSDDDIFHHILINRFWPRF
jgi:hypothetical protein